MNKKPSEHFIDEEIDQLIEQYHKKPTREVRDRLNTMLIRQKDKAVEKEEKKSRGKGKSLDREH